MADRSRQLRSSPALTGLVALLVVGVVVSASAGPASCLRAGGAGGGGGPTTDVVVQVAKLAAVARARVEKARRVAPNPHNHPYLTDRARFARAGRSLDGVLSADRPMAIDWRRVLGPMRLDLPPPPATAIRVA